MTVSKKILFYFALFFVFFGLFSYFDVNHSQIELNEYLGALLTVSAMVFTIMGIWIAFLYPSALSKIVHPGKVEHVDFDDSLRETKRLEGLVGSVLRSSIVAIFIVVFLLMEVVLKSSFENFEYVYFLKKLALSSVVVFTLVQLESIFYVIYSNVMFINDIHGKRQEREADEDI